MSIPIESELIGFILETLIELCKNKSILKNVGKIEPEYLLKIFHKFLTHNSTLQLIFVLLEQITLEEFYY
jgi:hypothetical protein